MGETAQQIAATTDYNQMSEPGAAPEEAAPKPVFAARKRNKKNMRKRASADDEEDNTTAVKQNKERKMAIGATTKNDGPGDGLDRSYKADRRVMPERDSKDEAVRGIETEAVEANDPQAIWERGRRLQQEQEGKEFDGKYKGLASYSTFHKINSEEVYSTGGGGVAKGPVRASQHYRATVIFDYKPDICKDYKDTGYCGYGDSCKFMHDRGDYKSGWQMEKEWDEKQKAEDKKKRERDAAIARGEDVDIEEEVDDGLPWACFICRNDFKDPVVTKCSHYFCSKCAIDNYKEDTACACCKEPTGGIFNIAKEITAKLARRDQKQADLKAEILKKAKKKARPAVAGEEINSSDEEKAIEEYNKAMDRRGAWKNQTGNEGWVMTGNTLL